MTVKAKPLADLPILAPLNAVLHDQKLVLTVLWLVTTWIAVSVPSLTPYLSVVVPGIAIAYSVLVLHQSYEDGLDKWRATAPTSIGDAINTIEVDATKDLLNSTPVPNAPNVSTGGTPSPA